MFKGTYQKKLLTILYSGGSNPLEIWDIKVKNGWTRRVKDEDLGNIVFEIAGTNVATAYIVCPPDPRAGLGISLPFITMFIKNLKRYFTFEIQILDDKQMRRRFRFSNYQSTTKVRPFACSVPLALKPGWNQMQLNLANFTTRAYGTNYLETQRVQIHANCRIRRIYFSDKLYNEEELPRDYRIYLNIRQAPQPQQPPPESLRTSIEKREGSMVAPSSILKRASQTGDAARADTKMDMESAEELFKSQSLSKVPTVEEPIVEEHIVEEHNVEDHPEDIYKKSKSVMSVKSKMSKVGSKSSVAEHPSGIQLKKSTISMKSKMSRVRTKSTLAINPIEEPEFTRMSQTSQRSLSHLPSPDLPIAEEAVVPEGEEIPEESDVEVEEPVAEQVPAISETEGEITDESELESPRTQVTESEYQESEPAPESDVEEPLPPESVAEEVAPEVEQTTE